MLRTISPALHLRILHRTFKLLVAVHKESSDQDHHQNTDTPNDNETEEDDAISTTTSKTTELPEEPTTCCMSGCANCVWLDYAEKINEYFEDGGEQARKEIEERVQDPNIKAFLLSELRMREKNKK